jgi:hypothetical protein
MVRLPDLLYDCIRLVTCPFDSIYWYNKRCCERADIIPDLGGRVTSGATHRWLGSSCSGSANDSVSHNITLNEILGTRESNMDPAKTHSRVRRFRRLLYQDRKATICGGIQIQKCSPISQVISDLFAIVCRTVHDHQPCSKSRFCQQKWGGASHPQWHGPASLVEWMCLDLLRHYTFPCTWEAYLRSKTWI